MDRGRGMSNNKISIPKKFFFSLILFVTFFYALDRGAKFLIKKYHISIQGDTVLPDTVIANSRISFVQPDQKRIWKLTPNTNIRRRDIYINSMGFRGPEFKSEKTTEKRIIMIGDSCTFGWGVGQNETIANKLSEYLMEKNLKVHVINAGVPGYSSFQTLQYLKYELINYYPDIITILVGWNDTWTTPSLDDKEIVSQRVNLISFNFFVRKFWVARLFSSFAKKKYYDKYKIETSLAKKKNRVSLSDFKKNIEDMISLSRERAITLILMTLPQKKPIKKLEVDKYMNLLSEIAKENKVILIDLIDSMPTNLEKNASLFLGEGDNIHYSAIGSKFIANIIAKTMLGSLNFNKSPVTQTGVTD